MRFSSLTIAAALSATALSQSLSSLPACAQTCVGNSLSSTGCNLLDIACICSSSGWLQMLSCCLATTCSTADQEATITFADQLCDAAGVQVPTAVSCASTQTSTAPASTATESSNAATASTSSSEAKTTSSASSTKSTTGSASAAGGSSSSHSSSSSASVVTQNAAHREGYGVGLGMAAAGLIAAVI